MMNMKKVAKEWKIWDERSKEVSKKNNFTSGSRFLGKKLVKGC